MRTPGYPLLLALFGLRIVPVIVVQHLLNAAVAAGIYVMTLRRLGSRAIALIAAILFAIDTPTLHYANRILTETVFTSMLFAVFALVTFRRALPVAGVLTGALVLIRPVAIVYFVAVAICLLLARVRPRTIAAYVALALALPLAWGLRNQQQTGVFTIASISGTNLLAYRAAGALAIEDDGDFDADLRDEQNGLVEDADEEIQRTLHIDDAGELPSAVRAQWYSRIAWRVLREHPRGAALLTLRGILVNIFQSRWEAMIDISRLPASVLQHALDAFTAITFVFAAIGAAALWKRDRPFGAAVIATVVYFILISAGGEAEARFRVPVIPQYMIAAACGVELARRRLTHVNAETRSSV
jgi:hypothetical protein